MIKPIGFSLYSAVRKQRQRAKKIREITYFIVFILSLAALTSSLLWAFIVMRAL